MPHFQQYKIVQFDEKSNGELKLNPSVIRTLINLARDGFGKFVSDQEVMDHVIKRDLLFVALKDKVEVGFSSLTYGKNEMQLGGAVIKKEEQKNGLYTLLTDVRVNIALQNTISKITTTTQNPRVEEGIIGVLNNLKLQKRILSYDFNREHLLGTYGRMLTYEIPKSPNEGLNKIYSQLNYDKGDAFKLSVNLKLNPNLG